MAPRGVGHGGVGPGNVDYHKIETATGFRSQNSKSSLRSTQKPGSEKVNIANFNLGRTGKGEAVSLLELDEFLNDSLILALEKLTNIKIVKALKF